MLKSRHNVRASKTAALASEASIWAASQEVWVGASCKRLLGGARHGDVEAYAGLLWFRCVNHVPEQSVNDVPGCLLQCDVGVVSRGPNSSQGR